MSSIADTFRQLAPGNEAQPVAQLPSDRYPPMAEGNDPRLMQGLFPRGGGVKQSAPQAEPVFKTTPEQEAQRIHQHYKGDLFNALKGHDSSPLWQRPDGVQRAAAVKQAIIDQASPQDIDRALQIERQFEQQNGMSYSQYQGNVFGSQQSHPKGLSDWLRYFSKEGESIAPTRPGLPAPE